MQRSYWYVCLSRPRQETIAVENLERQGFECYLPLWVAENRPPVPMFPRYLFVRPKSLNQSLSPIRSTRGVSHLMRFGHELAVASNAIIDAVRDLEVSVGSLQPSVAPGDTVEILSGPFAGYDAEVVRSGATRVIILMQVLGSVQELALPDNSVRRVS